MSTPPLQGSNIWVSRSAKLDKLIFFFFVSNIEKEKKRNVTARFESTLNIISLRDCTLELLYLNDFNMPPIETCGGFYVAKLKKNNLMLILLHRCKRHDTKYLAKDAVKLSFLRLAHGVSCIESALQKSHLSLTMMMNGCG